jgi:hypothetical protein
MAFELGSTNLVAELGIIMAILLGWQFTVTEFFAGSVDGRNYGPSFSVVSNATNGRAGPGTS